MPKMILEYKKAVISKIVETALEIFSTKGYQDLTMDEIAKKLGVSKGALYSYFTSKEDILKEIYKNGRQTMQKILCEASQADDLKQIMETIFKLTTEKYEKNIRIYFEILAIASHNENIKNILKDDYAKDFEVTHEFIQNLVKAKKVRTDIDSQILAQLFRSIWMGTSEKLILGYDIVEIHENWLASTSLVLSAPTRKS
jgi:AcrR family transcriptional regulator